MSSKEFSKLQIGMYVTDHQDTEDPGNYCLIVGFSGSKIRLQPYKSHGQPVNAHPFYEDYRRVNFTKKLFDSEYYALSHRFVNT